MVVVSGVAVLLGLGAVLVVVRDESTRTRRRESKSEEWLQKHYVLLLI
jgi:hypothetical protein